MRSPSGQKYLNAHCKGAWPSAQVIDSESERNSFSAYYNGMRKVYSKISLIQTSILEYPGLE